MSLPALVINEKVVSYGRILSRNDIKKLLNL
ncbi:MAG: thioredoxin family protein [Spirochaetia bacterium]|nr:thioredoxin family protein [Spirochaetia bacterium]